MRKLQRVGAGVLALALTTGITACGDDDDDTDAAAATTTTAAQGEDAGAGGEFCDAVVEFNSAVFDVNIDETSSEDEIKEVGGQLAELSQKLVDEAPSDVAAAAEEIHGLITPMEQEGDATEFNSDASLQTYSKFVGDASEACEFETVEVTASDYAFEAPDTVPAGTVAFNLTNASEVEEHEMILLTMKDGVDLSWDELLALPEEEAELMTEFIGATFAPPGQENITLGDLEAGDYVMVCFIPVGGAEDGPPHFTQGMKHEFTVE